ncbi:hypothetical protein C4K68_15035 [Pokkaliibacter plantistimulans]|uniref:Uncharacterized protein n=1 Tax=Proteobacteria bacterium 228 TaxID=2083153 RepID=A0A2S5KNZ4_9PROT|nr:hypothetical protein C4K68_15035 [Pokkaliibacter plantistimulans]
MILLLPFLLTIWLDVLPTDQAMSIIREDGPVENLSAAGYFVCALLTLLLAGRLRFPLVFIFLLVSLGLRELDLQYWIAPLYRGGFEKLALWWQLLIVAYGATLGTCLFQLARYCAKPFVKGLFEFSPAAVATFLAALAMVLSTMLDAGNGAVQIFDLTMSGYTRNYLEETVEMFIPVFFMLSLLIFFLSNPFAHFSKH